MANNKSININVQDSKVDLGVVSQGDHNKIKNKRAITQADGFQNLLDEIEKIYAARNDVTANELGELQVQVEEIKNAEAARMPSLLEILCEKYAWAAKPIRALIEILIK